VSLAVVLAGHGSRSNDANDGLVVLAERLEAELGVPVSAAFLEMAQPAIDVELRGAQARGATRIVLLPYFLSAGMHVKRDLAEIVTIARSQLNIPIEIADFLGSHDEIPRLLAELARKALDAPVV
jgi:sirohydrochlorin cobaltochelatase